MYPHALAAFFSSIGALGLAAGFVLLIVPRRMLRERSSSWRWLLEFNLAPLLDRRKSIERHLYRHHRLFSAVVIVGAVASLATLWSLPDNPLVMGVLSGILGADGVWMVILATWIMAIFVLGIGLFLLIRPSALKPFELAANLWVEPFPSSAEATMPTEAGINRLILRAPRVTGLLLLMASLVCLLTFAG